MYIRNSVLIFEHCFHGTNNISIIHDITIRLMGIVTTIFGLTLKPFVSSSKKRSNPALDAGNGAPFFLAMVSCQTQIFT